MPKAEIRAVTWSVGTQLAIGSLLVVLLHRRPWWLALPVLLFQLAGRRGVAAPALVQEALKLFGYSLADLDDRIPPAIANGGVHHLVLALASRAKLRAMPQLKLAQAGAQDDHRAQQRHRRCHSWMDIVFRSDWKSLLL